MKNKASLLASFTAPREMWLIIVRFSGLGMKLWTGNEVQWTGNEVQWTGNDVQWTGNEVQWTGNEVQWTGNETS